MSQLLPANFHFDGKESNHSSVFFKQFPAENGGEGGMLQKIGKTPHFYQG